MRIAEDHPDRLILKELGLFNWISAAFSIGISIYLMTGGLGSLLSVGDLETFNLFGWLGIAAGLYFGATAANVTVTFNAQTGTVTRTWKRAIGTKTNTYALTEIDRIRLKINRGGPEDADTSRFVMVMTDGTSVPLSPVSTSWFKSRRLPEKVAQWLDMNAPSGHPRFA